MLDTVTLARAIREVNAAVRVPPRERPGATSLSAPVSTLRSDTRVSQHGVALADAAPAPAATRRLAPSAYTIQIAAYTHRAPADSLASRLARVGYDARVTATDSLFRVRLGRFATRHLAEDAASHLVARGIAVYVTTAEVPESIVVR
jgi:cell division protein FtsN